MGIPQQIADYEILNELGRGSIGAVYQARNPSTGRELALRVMPRAMLAGTRYLERFEENVAAIADLNHPAIVPIFAFGEDDGQFYMSSPRLLGGSLEERLGRGPLALDDASQLVERIAPALDYAHERGVLHGNLRSSSILYDEQERAYLSDLGLVTLPEIQTELPHEVVMKALTYMAPEQIQRHPTDQRADIYALGVVLFEALTGQPPFSASNPQALAAQHLSKPVPGIRETMGGFQIGAPDQGRPGPPIPRGVEDVVARALAKSPAERFATAQELSAAWAMSLVGEPMPAPNVASPAKAVRPPVESAADPEPPPEARPADPPAPPASPPAPAAPPPAPAAAPSPSPRRDVEGRRGGPGFTVLVILLVSAIVVLLGIALASLNLLPLPVGTPREVPALSQAHNAGTLGMVVSLPQDWLVQDLAAFGLLSPEMAMTAAAPDQATLDSLFAAIRGDDLSLSGPIFLAMARSLQGLPDGAVRARPLMDEFKGDSPFSGFEAGATRNRQVDGEQAAWANFTAVDPATGFEIEGQMVTVVWSGQAGFVVGAAPTAGWRAFSPTFEAMVDAIDLLDTTFIVGGGLVPLDSGPDVDSQGEFTAGDGFETSAAWGIGVNDSGQEWALEDGPFANNWKFQGNAGWTGTITVRSQEQSFDPYLKLIGPDGRILGSNDDSGGGNWNQDPQLSIELPETGEYVARVTGYEETGGEYSISVTSP